MRVDMNGNTVHIKPMASSQSSVSLSSRGSIGAVESGGQSFPSYCLTLKMEVQTVSETLDYNSIVTRLISREDSLQSVAVKLQMLQNDE